MYCVINEKTMSGWTANQQVSRAAPLKTQPVRWVLFNIEEMSQTGFVITTVGLKQAGFEVVIIARLTGVIDGSPLKVAFIKANWHDDIVNQAVIGFKNEMTTREVDCKITGLDVPGAFEMPLLAQRLARRR